MKDSYGREITSLRLSVTQRCMLSCIYCHNEGQEKARSEMSCEEMEHIIRVASAIDIRKVKITGGEPLLREDIVEVVKRISGYMKETSLTTNGVLLSRYAEKLKNAGLARVNISVPSLNPLSYQRITGKDLLPKTIAGLQAAVAADLVVKINTVVLKGLNSGDIAQILEFSCQNRAVLQLIELEAAKDEVDSDFYRTYHFDLTPIESELQQKAIKIEKRELHNRKKYLIPFNGKIASVEIVKPMHNTEFCRNCSRIRVTSDGRLKPCLLSGDGLVDIIGLIRNKEDDDRLKGAFAEVIRNRKPYWR